MSIKIYTYSNPYSIDKTTYWNEIKDVPHLCASQVLVNSMQRLIGLHHHSLMCPIDNVLKVAYSDWYNNIQKHISQLVAVSRYLRKWRDEEPDTRESLYRSLRHNRHALLEAVRLCIELGLSPENFHPDHADAEQKLFVDILRHASNPEGELYEAFCIHGEYTLDELTSVFRDVISAEITNYEGNASDIRNHTLENLKRLSTDFTLQHLAKIVIHGIHQFTPLQLRFIQLLNKLGVEIIFLFNYQEKYKSIYDTWMRVYSLFGAEIKQDVHPYIPNHAFLGHRLAEALAQLHVDDCNNKENRISWYDIGCKADMLVFENLTEYADYISELIDKANHGDNESPFSAMKEKIYTANGEIHELLKVYYPDSSGGRHFLCYPIGQFFLALYNLWDEQSGNLTIDWALLARFFQAGFLLPASNYSLSFLLDIVQPYFQDVNSYDDFMARMDYYIEKYQQVQQMQSETGHQLRRIAFYNASIIRLDEIKALKNAVMQLKELATELFSEKQPGIIDFTSHFHKLRGFMNEQLPRLKDIDEKNLVKSLLDRLSTISQDSSLSGTLDELKDGLYFYLRQKDIEKPEWFVKNFEQIEGDILNSRFQAKNGNRDIPTYHFACLSDGQLNKAKNDVLPWPLTDDFLRSALGECNLAFQVYYTVKNEYPDFLKYSLFYGLYFNECPVRLSFVTHLGEDEEQLYFPLKVMGIHPRQYNRTVEVMPDITPELNNQMKQPAKPVVASRLDMMNFFLCPYKFYLDLVCKGDMTVDRPFLIRQYYYNMLVATVWKEMSGSPKTPKSKQIIRQKLKNAEISLKPYFPFYRDANDLYDLRRSAENYMNNHLWEGVSLKRYDPTHIDIRLLFRKALFSADIDSIHPYKAFDSLTYEDKGCKIYSLHKVPKLPSVEFHSSIKHFISTEKRRYALTGEWCTNCSHKELCMQPYLTNAIS